MKELLILRLTQHEAQQSGFMLIRRSKGAGVVFGFSRKRSLADFALTWSECSGSNRGPHGPKPCALPTAPHPVVGMDSAKLHQPLVRANFTALRPRKLGHTFRFVALPLQNRLASLDSVLSYEVYLYCFAGLDFELRKANGLR